MSRSAGSSEWLHHGTVPPGFRYNTGVMPDELQFAWDASWLPALAGAAAVALLFLFVLIWLLRLRRPVSDERRSPDLSIDVADLSDHGPPDRGPHLEVYGTRVRLSVVILAPVGRDGAIPPLEQLPELVEQLIPGLAPLLASHQPVVRCWPGQLSSQGFVQAFFNLVALPGERGKGTPWCSVAGKFGADGHQFLAGLVACADEPNGLSQFVIQHEGQWNDVLRVKRAEN